MNIPPREIPKDIDYQLIAVAVAGDRSFSQMTEMEKTGWRRVPNTRHPKIRSADPVWIEQGGLALVERPKLLTQRAKKWEQNKADAAVLNAVNAITSGLPSTSGGYIARVNGRPIPKVPPKKRSKSFREFFVFHGWRFKVWVQNKLGWRA